MPNPVKYTVALTASQTTGIALSQSLGAAGALTINGALASSGVATLTSTNCTARRVGITSAGNDSALTWTITGTDWFGNVISETLAGGNAVAVQSVRDYATVTKIAGSAATASTVTAGTTTVGSTPWYPLDLYREVFNVGCGVLISGTATVTLEYTFDDPNGSMVGSILPTSNNPPTALSHAQFNGISASASGQILFPVFAARTTVNSGTGSVTTYLLQSGACGP
jgi:hypothetical protein